ESTVIDVSSGEAVILRPGGVTPEDIASVAGGGRVRLNYAPEAAGPGGPGAPGDGESPKSPGVKYRHYAPDAEMLLLKGPRRAVAYWMGRIMERPPGAAGDASDMGRASKAGGVFGGPHEAGRPLGGGRPQHARAADYGILASDELLGMLPGGAGFATISLGSAGAPEIAASRLFGALRKFDAMGVGAILCEQPPESGLGLAIADRMKKAASGRVVDLGRASRALFVCTGNTCRSCMAEAIFNALASGALPAAASLAQFQALAHGPAQARQLAQLQAPTPEPAPAPPPAPVLASPPSLSSASAPMLSPAPASAPVPVPAPALSPAPPPACAWRASSAGLAAPDGSPASPEAVEALAAGWGIDLSGHRGRALAPDMLEEADLVLAMTKAHRDAILALRPESRYKVFTLLDGGADIPDPFGRNIGEYMSCAARIAAAVAALLEAIAPPPRAPGA
ncbi:MAG: hypothetical protein LBL83_03675, partial [Clostridiales bacterium]|nr:hypothetical protein [Clostridiales bacterium]